MSPDKHGAKIELIFDALHLRSKRRIMAKFANADSGESGTKTRMKKASL
jgi:hypothetical protein